jgi:hypothetical protein
MAEIKEGDKNIEVIEVIDELNNDSTSYAEILSRYSGDPKFIEQLKRTMKQKQVLKDVHQIINTDKGIEPTTHKEIHILTPDESMPKYSNRLIALERQLEERNFWAYDVIDNCLHIGIYKGDKRFGGSLILHELAKQLNHPNYIIEDELRVFESLNMPIFFLPFSKDLIFDLIFRRKIMLFMLDIDSYIELYTEFGFTAEWASKKESLMIVNMAKEYDVFLINNRGIKIKSLEEDAQEFWLSHGTFTRIFFEQIYPRYMAYSSRYYLENKKTVSAR